MTDPIPATLLTDPDGEGADSKAALSIADADGEQLTLEVAGPVGRMWVLLTYHDAHDLANRLHAAVDDTVLA